MWKELRCRKFKGHKFRRQHPLKSFIADFYCHSSSLIVEIDGEYHNSEDSKKYDESRTEELSELGIRVVRFSNHKVIHDLENVLKEIERNLTPIPSSIEEGN